MKTILIIEDNINILENLTEIFELEGYKIISANNGKKGVEIAREYIPDLIICDILMPEMDGYGVLSKIIDIAKTYEIPFIFNSSLSENADRIKALELGADDFITKPFETETLLRMTKSWIKSGTKRRTTLEFTKLQINW